MENLLSDAVRRFCRSIELCDGYLRGYYGLKIVGERLVISRRAPGTNYLRPRIDYSMCFIKTVKAIQPIP